MDKNIFFLDNKKCISCFSCVRSCPVKAIYVRKGEIKPQINSERCIACGNCINSCSYNAITYYDSKEDVMNLLSSDYKVAAICDPSIAGEFEDITDYRKFVKMIRHIGFDYVCEVAFGVDIIAKRQAMLCSENTGKSYLTSHCPVMTMYIEKYRCELVNNITPSVSPAAATAVAIRNVYGEDIKAVSITPCLGAKKDIERHSNSAKIDAVLTFVELRELFKKLNIKEEWVEYSDFDKPLGYKGALYPLAEGFVESCDLSASLIDGVFISAQGKTDAIDAVKQFYEHGNKFNKHFNLYFCKGCIEGPGSSVNAQKFIRHNLVTEYVKKRIRGFNLKEWETNIETLSNKADLICLYKANNKKLPTPTQEEIEKAFEELGKKTNGRNINCKSCGYNSCLDLATSIAQGVASAQMCFTHTQSGNRVFSNELNQTKSNFIELQKQYDDLKNNLSEQQSINFESNKALSLLIHNINPGIAIINNQLKIVESNTGFIDILGEDAREIDEVIPGLKGANINSLMPKDIVSQIEYVLKSGEDIMSKDNEFAQRLINISIFSLIPKKTVGVIFRNLFDEQERPEEIIHRVTEVIQENLRQVQQIGFILGEGAAKTEKMLNSIIKTYKEQIGKN